MTGGQNHGIMAVADYVSIIMLDQKRFLLQGPKYFSDR